VSEAHVNKSAEMIFFVKGSKVDHKGRVLNPDPIWEKICKSNCHDPVVTKVFSFICTMSIIY
jgi:hypothetical protein